MTKKLYRNDRNRVVGGVSTGLSEYLDIDVTIIRILFVAMFLFGGSGLLIYIILWIAVPKKPFVFTDYTIYENQASNVGSAFYTDPGSSEIRGKKSSQGRIWAGAVLILLGAFFLLDEFDIVPDWFEVWKLWPLALIIPGLLILVNSRKKDDQVNTSTNSQQNTVVEDVNEINPDQPII